MDHRSSLLLALLLASSPAAAGSAAAAATADELLGRGFQIYACSATAGTAAWTLKAPEADLVDALGHVAGRHFAGPSWQAADGSKVQGKPVVASASPDPGAIPWLVLQVTTRDGAGRFGGVSYISRTKTQGGVAPATGCDAGHTGAETRVPYSATYTFFTPAGP